jgi:hypothetical protein
MNISRVRLTKTQILAIPEPDRSYLIALGTFLDEINILQRLLISSINTKTTHPIEVRAHLAQTMLFAKLLCGKLYEGRQLTNIGAKYIPKCPPIAQTALSQLNRYFSGTNLISRVRNSFAFHSDRNEIAKFIPDIADTDDYEFFLHEKIHSSMYYACDFIANLALISEVKVENIDTAMGEFIDEYNMVFGWFKDFGGHCIAEMMSHFIPEAVISEDVELKDRMHFEEVPLPFFVKGREA